MKFDDYTADSLYAGILDHPTDTLRRLILADRMDEIGQSDLAEFVRVQCELAVSPGNDSGRIILQYREQALSRVNDWFAPFGHWVDGGGTVVGVYPPGVSPRHSVASAVISDGLPSEIRAPMEWLVGGVCGVCDGWRIDTLHDDRTGRTDHVPCPACSGTGHIVGHLPDLVKRFPITKVVVSDRTPWHMSNAADGRLRWSWHNTPRGDSRADLPPIIYETLECEEDATAITGSKRYFSPTNATAALSKSLILVAKRYPLLLN